VRNEKSKKTNYGSIFTQTNTAKIAMRKRECEVKKKVFVGGKNEENITSKRERSAKA
jgi:hypothetical protein